MFYDFTESYTITGDDGVRIFFKKSNKIPDFKILKLTNITLLSVYEGPTRPLNRILL